MSSPAMLTPELTPSQSNASSPSLPATPDARPLDIIVSQYNEDLTWLAPYATLATVYSKGTPPSDPTIYHQHKQLPNIGRESHTYLHHISQNYDNLADVTIFFQGNIHDENDGTPSHTDLTVAEIIGMAERLNDLPDLHATSGDNTDQGEQKQNKPTGGILPLGLIHTFDSWHGVAYKKSWQERRGKTLQHSQYTPAQFWNLLINDTTNPTSPSWVNPPKEIRWTQGALFAITRQTIQRRPKSVWLRAYEFFDGAGKVNPEEGHFMERFWLSLFSCPDYERATPSHGDVEEASKAGKNGVESFALGHDGHPSMKQSQGQTSYDHAIAEHTQAQIRDL